MESNVIDNTLVFSFSERLDTTAAMSLQKDIVDSIAAHERSLAVRFDFAGVKYLASGFIRILMIVARMKGKDFSVVNTGPEVKQILSLANLEQIMSIS
jgi:anti-anti-sigma factor